MIGEAKFWDGVAERYAKSKIRDEDAYEATLERVRAYLAPGDRALEIGAGTGTTALKLADAVAHLTASDISGEMSRIGREKAQAAGVENVEFVTAGVDALPEGPFDVVMGFNLFHLVRDLDGALAEVSARVKPGGLFISKTACLAGPGVPLGMQALIRLGLPVMQAVGKAPFVRRMRVSEMEAAVERAGFAIIETGDYPARPPSRFIVARMVG